MLHVVVLTFESVDEILKCDHLNESYWAVLPYLVQFIIPCRVALTPESVNEMSLFHRHFRASGAKAKTKQNKKRGWGGVGWGVVEEIPSPSIHDCIPISSMLSIISSLFS